VLAPALALILLPLLALVVAAQELQAFRVALEVETTSDWTHVAVEGLSPTSYRVVEGGGAPDLRVEVAGGEVRIHKRQYDTTLVRVRVEGWLAFARDEAAVEVTKGDLGYTTLRLYALIGGAESLVWNFTNEGVVPGSGGLNPRSSRIPLSLFSGAGGRGVVLRERAVPKLVLAFYYPWYGNPQGPSGRWFHWEGVSVGEIRSATDYPLLGPYDSWDERVVRSHIRMAKAAGIDGFICSWWGIGSFEDAAFSRMLDVAAEEGFNLTIYYESVREMTREQVVSELSYVLERYSRHPAFLKLEGRPVVFLYAVEAMGRGLDFWREVLREVERRTGVSAVYIGDTFNTAFLSIFDGIHTYIPIWIKDLKGTYASVAARVRSFVGPEEEPVRRLWVATVCPGYDDRKVRSPGTYVPREEGRYYRATWEAALESGADLILICTWNEWHEGTEVEPSVQYGFSYLNLTRVFAERFKGTAPPSPAPPSLNLSIGRDGDRVRVVIENRGGAAVITRLTATNVAAPIVVEPRGMRVYWLLAAPSSYALFIPLIDSGERVVLEFAPTGGEVSVRLEAWSATGEKVTAEGSLRVEGGGQQPQVRQPQQRGSGGPGALQYALPAAVVAAVAAALALLRLRWPRRKSC